jgi:hypothetical protein
VKRGNARIISVTLVLFVGVLAVVAPWCLVPRCAQAMPMTAAMTDLGCAPLTAHQFSAACNDMRTGTPITAVSPTKALHVPDLFATMPSSIAPLAPVALRAILVAPTEDPPRLVLDTSRLRI